MERIKYDPEAPPRRMAVAQREDRAGRVVTEAERIRKGLDRYARQLRRDHGDLTASQLSRVLKELAAMRDLLVQLEDLAVGQ